MPSGLKGYNIYLDEEKMNNAPVAESAAFQITGLNSGTDYSDRIWVAAVDNAGNESTPVSIADIEGPASAVTTTPTPDDLLGEEIRTAIDGFVAANLKPNTKCDGAIIGVKAPEGSYYKAYGGDRTADSPLTLDDKSRYGSITKMYTSLLVLKRIDDGLLSLDDKLDQFVTGVQNGAQITIKHLLMMQSGIKDYLQQDAAVQQQYFLNPTAAFDPLPKIRSYAPLFAPGTSSSYSNSNTFLLGMILEWVDAQYGTGRDIRTIMIEDLLIPLGLVETEWPTAVNMTPPYSRAWATNAALPQIQSMLGPFAFLAGVLGYPTTEEIEWTAVHPSYAGAAGVLDGTIADLVKFGEAIASGALLSPEMEQLRNETFVTYTFYTPVNPWDGPGWLGFGLGVIKYGAWLGWVGNLGGYVSVMFANPDTGAVVAVLMNHMDNAVSIVDLGYRICYLLDPESTLDTQAWVRPSAIASASSVRSPSVYVYHDPTNEVPADVPLYI